MSASLVGLRKLPALTNALEHLPRRSDAEETPFDDPVCTVGTHEFHHTLAQVDASVQEPVLQKKARKSGEKPRKKLDTAPHTPPFLPLVWKPCQHPNITIQSNVQYDSLLILPLKNGIAFFEGPFMY